MSLHVPLVTAHEQEQQRQQHHTNAGARAPHPISFASPHSASYLRRVMEGSAESDAAGSTDEAEEAEEEGEFDAERAIRKHRASLRDSSLFADNLRLAPGGDDARPLPAFCPRWAQRLCTPRCKTLFSLLLGGALVLVVLLTFVVLLTRNLQHAPLPEELSTRVFRAQVLGQSLLRHDFLAQLHDADAERTPRPWPRPHPHPHPHPSNDSAPTPESERRALHAWLREWNASLTGEFVLNNFESAVTGPFGGVDWRRSIFSHVASPATLDLLRRAGANVLSCANNHVFDLMEPGIWNLLQALQERNMTCAGLGENLAAATAPQLLRGKSKGLTLALLAMASGSLHELSVANDTRPGVNDLRVNEDGSLDPEDLGRNLAAVRAAAASPTTDLVAVVHHNHYRRNSSAPLHEVDEWRVALARRTIDAGASLHVSQGVPVLQGLEIYRGAPILYGTGNFAFQSHAGPAHWGEDAYDGALFDLGWGCVSCDGPDMPVAWVGGALFGGRQGQVARSAKSKLQSLFGSAAPRASALSSSDSASALGEMSTDESLLSAAAQERLQRLSPDQRLEEQERQEAYVAETGRMVVSATAVDAASLPRPTVPTPTNPSTNSKCPCGYRLTSLTIRPTMLALPGQGHAQLPPSLRFNNSYGMPSLRVPKERAERILRTIAERSRRFGTKMEIVHRDEEADEDDGEGEHDAEGGGGEEQQEPLRARDDEDPQPERRRRRRTVYARVILDLD